MNSTFPGSSGDCEREDERDEDLQWKKCEVLEKNFKEPTRTKAEKLRPLVCVSDS